MSSEEAQLSKGPGGPSNELLDSWSTSYGLVILGWLCSSALGALTRLLPDDSGLSSPAFIFLIVLAIAFTVLILVYALVIYPSFFTDKPKLRSSKTVSFLNGFVGGIIFGFIWCSNLKKRIRGISHGVYSFIVIAALIISVISGFLLAMNEPAPSSNTANTQRIQVDSAYVGDWKMVSYYPDGNNTDEVYSADELSEYGLSDFAISIRSNGQALWSLTVDGAADSTAYRLENRPEALAQNHLNLIKNAGGYILVDNNEVPCGYIVTKLKGQTYLYLYIFTEGGSLQGAVIAFSKS